MTLKRALHPNPFPFPKQMKWQRQTPSMAINSNSRIKKPTTTSLPSLFILFLSLFILTLPIYLLLNSPTTSIFPCTSTTITASAATSQWSGDLREAAFSWNHLKFSHPLPETLKIAVFSRKWPASSSPGGMERHALTLHTALARRGHNVHVFTSPPPVSVSTTASHSGSPEVHFVDGEPGKWRCSAAWTLFETENLRQPFDLVHSESVSLTHSLARSVPNLAVSWHGIALEGLQSAIYQDLVRLPGEPRATSLNRTLSEGPHKILKEIKFFKSYAHHVAISDSSGEILRDVYQIPKHRVHVILNGVDDGEFSPDAALGKAFRETIGLPESASLVMGVAGRLVKDKGHPLLQESFSQLMVNHTGVYLIVAGSGPWARRYAKLGPRVLTLGALPPAKLKAFYNAIDVFVDPTLRPQGLDLTLMEAMQCGKPVIATRLPSIKGSIVVSDEFGFMFSPNVDSLLEVLERVMGEGAGGLAERGRACKQYASSMFTSRKMAMAYERLFLCIKNESYCKYPMHFDNRS